MLCARFATVLAENPQASIKSAQYSTKTKTPSLVGDGVIDECSLTMTYFHTGIRTIIGAKAFHCPVRDGKEWFHLAMIIRL